MAPSILWEKSDAGMASKELHSKSVEGLAEIEPALAPEACVSSSKRQKMQEFSCASSQPAMDGDCEPDSEPDTQMMCDGQSGPFCQETQPDSEPDIESTSP